MAKLQITKIEDIDNIIAFIKKSASSAAAKEGLSKEYNFTAINGNSCCFSYFSC